MLYVVLAVLFGVLLDVLLVVLLGALFDVLLAELPSLWSSSKTHQLTECRRT